MAEFDDLPQRAFAPRLTRAQGDVEDPYSTADILGQMNKPETFPDWLKRQADKIPESGRTLEPRGPDESLFSYWKRAADALSVHDMAKGGVNTVANWLGATKGTGQTAQPGEGYGFAATGLTPTDTIAPTGMGFMGMSVAKAAGALPKDAVGVFGGELAHTADHAALARAKEMASGGIDRDTIWKETGWGLGPDGKWRFEIDDSRARLTDPFEPGAYEKVVAAHVPQKQNPGYIPQALNFEEFMSHPDLAKAYWPLREQSPSVIYDDLGPRTRGNYSEPSDMITMDSSSFLAKDGGKSTGLHEVQHAIQSREGFARGDSIPKGEGGKRQLDEVLGARRITDAMSQQGLSRDAAIQWLKIKGTPPSPGAEKWLHHPPDKLAEIESRLRSKISGDEYWRSAGEVEARNVTKRMDYTPEQRRSTPPWKTQDVPDEQQIVRFGSSGPQMSSYNPLDHIKAKYLEWKHPDDLPTITGGDALHPDSATQMANADKIRSWPDPAIKDAAYPTQKPYDADHTIANERGTPRDRFRLLAENDSTAGNIINSLPMDEASRLNRPDQAQASTRAGTGLGHPDSVPGALPERAFAPIRAYHGTQSEKGFDKFKRKQNDVGVHFGTAGQANDRIDYLTKMGRPEDGARVFPADLDIRNPLRMTDMGGWGSDNLRMGLEEAGFTKAELKQALGSARNESGKIAALRDLIHSKGYDGIVYKNTGESDGGVMGVDSYIATKKGTVKSATTGETLFSKSDNQAGTAINALGEAQKAGLPERAFGKAPDLSKIVNPIDPKASRAEKLRQIQALTDENHPILENFTRHIDALLGTDSKVSIKEPAKIAEKASRPSILAEKPWHDVEHIRDTLRFKTVVDHLDQIPKAIDELPEGFGIVKKDTEKLFAPKEWGFPIVAFDLRAPNGQLLEWYQPIREVEAAKKEGHKIFERWRNLTKEETNANYAAFLDDIRASNKLYSDALLTALRRMGFGDLTEARASWSKISASLPDSTEKLSWRSKGAKGVPEPASDHFPAAFRAKTNSPSATSARPLSESSMASRFDMDSSSYGDKWHVPERAFKPTK